MQKPIITILLLIICLAAATKIRSFIKNNAPSSPVPVEEVGETETVICTMDAMMCPDGSYVGRSGPKCEFKCPEVSEASTTEKVFKPTLSLNQIFELDSGIQFSVLAVTEDSRCPSDVTCIWAGTAKIILKADSSSEELEIGKTMTTPNGFLVTFEDIKPYPVSTQKTRDEDYRFIISIKPTR